MARIIDIKDSALTEGEFCVRNTEIVRQYWANGWEYNGYRHTPRPHSALVLICSEMKAVFVETDSRTVVARQGDVLFAPRGLCYTAGFYGGGDPKQPDSHTINFDLFTPEGEELLLADHLAVIAHDGGGRFASHIEGLLHASALAAVGNRFKLGVRFLSLLDEIIDEARSKDADYYPIRVGAEALCNEWRLDRPIGHYAALCGMCESYFYQLFKKWSGASPVAYRNRIRMTSAASLLTNTDLSIGEIAATVGFEDPFYFSRAFRRYHGVSPLQYRKSHT